MTTVIEAYLKPFAVAGETISAEQIRKVEPTLRRDRFTFGDIGKALALAGASYDNSDRAADRLLQRCRKLGLVVAMRGGWAVAPHGWALIDRPRDSDRRPSGPRPERARVRSTARTARSASPESLPNPLDLETRG